MVERIEKLAKKGDLTRSKLISNIIEVGVEEVEAMNKMGVWATARIFEDIRQRLKKRHEKRKTVQGLKKQNLRFLKIEKASMRLWRLPMLALPVT